MSSSSKDSKGEPITVTATAAASVGAGAGAARKHMRMDHITFTGADDKSNPADLINFLCAHHNPTAGPRIEIGFLVSRPDFGSPKYPTHKWIKELDAALTAALATTTAATTTSTASSSDGKKQSAAAAGASAGSAVPPNLRQLFSVHVCNDWAAELAENGSTECFEQVSVLASGAISRVQLNFSRSLAAGKANATKLLAALTKYPKLEFIFQLPTFDDYSLVLQARAAGIRAFGFFDPSAGMGISPKNGWPKPPSEIGQTASGAALPVGYAGGLGPTNLLVNLEEISGFGASTPHAAGRPFWVDMETNVRTNNEFDLAKVLFCVNISKPFF